ncbi:MAG: hypothetical protein F6K26_23465 [Moorea sp. SIO2I5]|nr:hypothetical protein [Moorena sp. SIO2I5]
MRSRSGSEHRVAAQTIASMTNLVVGYISERSCSGSEHRVFCRDDNLGKCSVSNGKKIHSFLPAPCSLLPAPYHP